MTARGRVLYKINSSRDRSGVFREGRKKKVQNPSGELYLSRKKTNLHRKEKNGVDIL